MIALREIFKHGQGCNAVTSNPCVGLKVSAIVGTPKPKRARIQLSQPELQIILPRLDEMGLSNSLIFKILLITAVRNGELLKAEWNHVNFEEGIWTIPAKNIKTVRGEINKLNSSNDFQIPLDAVVLNCFRQLKLLAGNSRWVCPARAKSKKNAGIDSPCAYGTINNMISKFCSIHRNSCRRFTPHDLRSTSRSHLSHLEARLDVKERYLNHSLGGMSGVYDKNTLLVERKNAMQKLVQFYAENGCSFTVDEDLVLVNDE